MSISKTALPEEALRTRVDIGLHSPLFLNPDLSELPPRVHVGPLVSYREKIRRALSYNDNLPEKAIKGCKIWPRQQ